MVSWEVWLLSDIIVWSQTGVGEPGLKLGSGTQAQGFVM